jgi:hypothetical protein
MTTTHEHQSFHVGDHVRIDFGKRKLSGVIVEDRGAIGVGGRHLFRVDVPMDPFDPMSIELPETELEAVESQNGAAAMPEKAKIVDYLKSGGLISILRSNISGGKNQPRAWICLDNLGNVTHTFVPERGIIGGQVVPFLAVQDDKIFPPKRDSVLTILESFGLNHQDAEAVISEVGTAP